MSLRRLLSLCCLALCATALVGCGGDTLALDPVANAANKTAETDSARIAFSATIRVGNEGTMTMKGRGIFDGRSKTGWMTMGFSLPQGAQAQIGGSSSAMEMIFDGHDGLVMYMRSPLFEQQLGSNKWVKMDMEKLAKKQGLDLGSLMNANQADPNQALQMLMASSNARVSGTDTIRGVRTTRYSFRVDLRRLAEDNKALRDSLDKVIKVMGVDAYPAEAWIDAEGRVRRLKIAMSMNTPQGAMSMTMVEDLYDFGARAEIFPPADDEVIDLSSLMGG
jgi:hypothetical protein